MPALVFAIIPSALIFALFHFFTGASPTAFTILFMMGIVLGLLHELFNDIGVPMVAHIVNNVFAMMSTVIAILTGNILIIGLAIGLMILTYVMVKSKRSRK